jgi:hypothetical protein
VMFYRNRHEAKEWKNGSKSQDNRWGSGKEYE